MNPGTPAEPGAKLPPTMPHYDTHGRPAFHESNVLLELRVRVNGRLFTAREAIDPFMFEHRFGEADEFEKFIRFFIRNSCGRMATDPDAYQYFRDLVRVVHPRDRHDFKRCADGMSASPRCDLGIITKAPLVVVSTPDVIEPPTCRADVLGICPCRCHKYDGSGAHSGALARTYLLPQFDEDQLDEDGNPR